jgi:serine/threonine protein kinase
MIPPIDDPLVVRVLDATLAALEVAHERGFIHRDITPTNILDIGKDTEQWVLADWGLVRPPSGTTVTRTQTGTFGTEAFAAPETWIDAHVADHRADIYSLGRVVAWCVTGSPLIPNVPLVPQGRWKDLVENATAFRPGERCQTLNDFRLLLSNVIAIPADEETELFGPIDSAMAAPLDLMESVLKEMNRLDIDLPWPISGPFASYFSLRIVTGYVAAGRMDSAVRAILRYSGLGQERAEKLVETLHRVLEVVRK